MAIKNVLQYILLIFLVSIPVCALIVMAVYATSYPQHFTWCELPILAVTGVIYWFIIKKLKLPCLTGRAMTITSYTIANVAMVISLATFDTQPCSDYITIFDVARQMSASTYDVHELPYYHYMYIFNYQTGICAFVSLLIRAFGDSFWVLKIFNLLVINVTLYLTQRVAKRLCNPTAASYALLLMATFYPVLITVNQFTNQHLAAPLILIALLALDHKSWWAWIIAGCVAAFTNIVRPMGIILALTALAYTLYYMLGHLRDKRLTSSAIVMAVSFMIGYVGCNTVFDKLFITLHYTDGPIGQTRLTYFKFDKGLTGYDAPDVYNYNSVDEFNQWEKAKLKDKLKHEPEKIAWYVTTKMIRYQGEFDWKFENTYDHNPTYYNHYPIKGFVMMGWAQYIIMAVLAIIGYRAWRMSHDLDAFQIFYIGITAVYIFIEAFSSYRYESYPILLIFAATGIRN